MIVHYSSLFYRPIIIPTVVLYLFVNLFANNKIADEEPYEKHFLQLVQSLQQYGQFDIRSYQTK